MEKVPFLRWLPFIAVLLVVFYAIPPFFVGTDYTVAVVDEEAPEEEQVTYKRLPFEYFALKIFTPAVCLGSGIVFGKINGWVWYYCIVVALLFAPSLVLFFTPGDIPYIFQYGGLALMGSLIGYAFHRDRY